MLGSATGVVPQASFLNAAAAESQVLSSRRVTASVTGSVSTHASVLYQGSFSGLALVARGVIINVITE